MLGIIQAFRPRDVVAENVPGLVSWNDGLVFEQVQADLEAAGYAVQSFVLPACGTGAPHQRDRVWIVARRIDRASATATDATCRPWDGRDGTEEGGVDNWEASIGSEASDISNGLCSDRVVADPHGICGRSGTGRQDGQEIDNCSEGATPDAGRISIDRREADEPEQGIGYGDDSGREEASDIPSGCDPQVDATYSTILGMEGSGATGEQEPRGHGGEGVPWSNYTGTDWSKWPSVPALCNGDAWPAGGLSDTPLPEDFNQRGKPRAFTYNRWRNESLKALGNSVQYEVVMQIFKAIIEYDKQHGSH